MLGLSCPSCGRPTPVSLAATTAFVCIACGARGPMPAAVRARLEAAAAALHRLDARSRQMSGRQRAALAASYDTVIFVLVLLLVPCAGLEGLVAYSAVTNYGAEDWPTIVEAAGGLGCTVGACGLVLWLLRRGRRRLEVSYAADLPAVPGQPATCHVCGADLEMGIDVVRCRFCAADNIVTREVLERAAASRHVVLDGHDVAVARSAMTYDIIARASGGALLGIIPIAAIVGHGGVRTAVAAADAWVDEEPPRADVRYVGIRTKPGGCLQVTRADGKGNALVRRAGRPTWVRLPPSVGARTVGAEAFVDAGVGGEHRGRTFFGDVIRVYAEEGRADNRALIRHDRGDVRLDVSSLCVVVRPGTVPEVEADALR